MATSTRSWTVRSVAAEQEIEEIMTEAEIHQDQDEETPAVILKPKKKTPVKRAPRKKPGPKPEAQKLTAPKPKEISDFMRQQAEINSSILQELQQLRKDKCQSPKGSGSEGGGVGGD